MRAVRYSGAGGRSLPDTPPDEREPSSIHEVGNNDLTEPDACDEPGERPPQPDHEIHSARGGRPAPRGAEPAARRRREPAVTNRTFGTGCIPLSTAPQHLGRAVPLGPFQHLVPAARPAGPSTVRVDVGIAHVVPVATRLHPAIGAGGAVLGRCHQRTGFVPSDAGETGAGTAIGPLTGTVADADSHDFFRGVFQVRHVERPRSAWMTTFPHGMTGSGGWDARGVRHEQAHSEREWGRVSAQGSGWGQGVMPFAPAAAKRGGLRWVRSVFVWRPPGALRP